MHVSGNPMRNFVAGLSAFYCSWCLASAFRWLTVTADSTKCACIYVGMHACSMHACMCVLHMYVSMAVCKYVSM